MAAPKPKDPDLMSLIDPPPVNEYTSPCENARADWPAQGMPGASAVQSTYAIDQGAEPLGQEDLRYWLPKQECRIPETRQSNEADLMLCPRYYLLAHKFGLRRLGYFSQPATRGIMYHQAMRDLWMGLSWEATLVSMDLFVAGEKERLATELADRGALYATITDELEANKQVALAMARYTHSVTKLPDGVVPVAIEQALKLKIKVPSKDNIGSRDYPNGIFVGTPDLVLLDTEGRLLADAPGYWIVDYKTLGRTKVADKARTLSFAFQPRMYRILLEEWLKNSPDAVGLPKLPVRGVYFVLVRVPQIRLSMADRDFTYQERVLTRESSKGSKGEVIQEKVYTGAPKFENYLRRITDWYMATGDYASEQEERRDNPMLKVTHRAFPADRWPTDFNQRLFRAGVASRALPLLRTFPTNDRACNNFYGSNCPMLDICETPAESWQSVVTDRYKQMSIPTYSDDLERTDAHRETYE